MKVERKKFTDGDSKRFEATAEWLIDRTPARLAFGAFEGVDPLAWLLAGAGLIVLWRVNKGLNLVGRAARAVREMPLVGPPGFHAVLISYNDIDKAEDLGPAPRWGKVVPRIKAPFEYIHKVVWVDGTKFAVDRPGVSIGKLATGVTVSADARGVFQLLDYADLFRGRMIQPNIDVIDFHPEGEPTGDVDNFIAKKINPIVDAAIIDAAKKIRSRRELRVEGKEKIAREAAKMIQRRVDEMFFQTDNSLLGRLLSAGTRGRRDQVKRGLLLVSLELKNFLESERLTEAEENLAAARLRVREETMMKKALGEESYRVFLNARAAERSAQYGGVVVNSLGGGGTASAEGALGLAAKLAKEGGARGGAGTRPKARGEEVKVSMEEEAEEMDQEAEEFDRETGEGEEATEEE